MRLMRDHYALEIQRHVRGFLSRRRISNFREVKRFIAELSRIHVATRKDLLRRQAENARLECVTQTKEERIRQALRARALRHLGPTLCRRPAGLRI